MRFLFRVECFCVMTELPTACCFPLCYSVTVTLCRSQQYSSCCCTIRKSRCHWRLHLTQKSKALPSRPRKSTMPSPQSSSERMNFNVGWVGCILIKVVAFRIHRCCPGRGATRCFLEACSRVLISASNKKLFEWRINEKDFAVTYLFCQSCPGL
jgi:hypothetical protein